MSPYADGINNDMFLTMKTKSIAILIALLGVVFLMMVTPFVIVSPIGIFSENAIRSLFGLAEFFVAVFFLNEYHRIKIVIQKDKVAGQKSDQMIRDIAGKFNGSKIGMKGIILAGGTATRLFPLTATTSKQLLPVYDRQMIFYPINVLVQAGIKDILIIVAPEHSGQFLNLLGSIFEKYNIHIEFKVQKIPRGLADAFIMGEDFIDEGNVAMILGDNIFEDDLGMAIRGFEKGGMVFAKEVKDDPSRYGIIEFDASGKAISIEEKPENPKSNFCVTGAYVFDNRVVEIAKNLAPSNRGEIEITDINRKYLEMGELQVNKLAGEWMDAGTFDSLLETGKIVKEKEIYKKFNPMVDEAIGEFNKELKELAKKRLG